MAEDLNKFVREVLQDRDVALQLERSPKLYELIKRLYQQAQILSGNEEDDGFLFPVKSGSEVNLLRCCDIYFFESQGRRIAIRTKAQEILIYSNFDQITEQTPDHFIRCHRGYIVNTHKIRSVNYSDNLITMNDDSIVPFSRTYRDEVREAVDRISSGGIR